MVPEIEHRVVYRRAGRFAGWPANYGIWSWGDEIVAAFTLGYMGDDNFHRRDRSQPFTTLQARSRDGGHTWSCTPMSCASPGGRALSADEHQIEALQIAPLLKDDADGLLPSCPENLDFTHTNFALFCARSGLGGGTLSWFYTSIDRASSWQGPYRMDDFGLPGVSARTDYLVQGPHEALLFLTAAKSDGREGRPFCARALDGGRRFEFAGWIGPEPQGYAIMPAAARLADGRLGCAVRRLEQGRGSIEWYHSADEGGTWILEGIAVDSTGKNGNPPALVPLSDGRLCLVYGFRDPPYGIRARISNDNGASWGTERVLRTGAGDGDIGYVRAVQRPDGRIVTLYYYNDIPQGERYIAATLWNPS
jgi:hypothetical protein